MLPAVCASPNAALTHCSAGWAASRSACNLSCRISSKSPITREFSNGATPANPSKITCSSAAPRGDFSARKYASNSSCNVSFWKAR